MYSQQPISDELDHSLLESESDEDDDDDIIPKNANVKEIKYGKNWSNSSTNLLHFVKTQSMYLARARF